MKLRNILDKLVEERAKYGFEPGAKSITLPKKKCKNCKAEIESGKYCPSCKKDMEPNKTKSDYLRKHMRKLAGKK